MLIAVVNESPRLSSQDAQRAVDACSKQLIYHAGPVWGKTAHVVILYPTETHVPAGADLIVFLDNADQAGALGYHDETPGGRPYGKIFVADCLKDAIPPSSCLSHEVLELFVNPTCCGWEWDGNQKMYAREVGDPVENDWYVIMAHDGTPVEVSNFVWPSWFDPQATPGSRFDQMRNVTAPFTMTPRGYVIVMQASQESQQFNRPECIFGSEYPEGKKAGKNFAASRTQRIILNAIP